MVSLLIRYELWPPNRALLRVSSPDSLTFSPFAREFLGRMEHSGGSSLKSTPRITVNLRHSNDLQLDLGTGRTLRVRAF
jgi:hypothetical protein